MTPTAPTRLVGDLLPWFDRNARALPWRRAGCPPWWVLVSEVMLQQTPVRRVLPVWREWTGRWPAPADLAAATAGDAVRAWGRLGYPRRALRLHACAVTIAGRHDGRVPREHDALLALPGVGGYTAAAVAAFAFRDRRVVLDTNVRRVLARVVGGQPLAAAHLTRAEVRRAESVLPADAALAARWSAAAMELGALVCTARAPRCPDCPVQAHCSWRRAGSPPPTRAVRSQAWAGTDRQARGRLLAAVRDGPRPLDAGELARAWPADDAQRERCVAGLLADGLIRFDADGRCRLPG